jgi:hypothetical protein
MQPQNISVRSLLVEIRILQTVSRICQRQLHRISTKLLHALSAPASSLCSSTSSCHSASDVHSCGCPGAICLQGRLQHGCTARTSGCFGPDLCRRNAYRGVEVVEFVLQRVGFLFGERFRVWPWSVAEDVLPGFVCHLLGRNAQGARCPTEDIAA